MADLDLAIDVLLQQMMELQVMDVMRSLTTLRTPSLTNSQRFDIAATKSAKCTRRTFEQKQHNMTAFFGCLPIFMAKAWEMVPGLFSTRPFSTRHFSTRHISTKALLYQDISLPWTPLYQDTFLPRHISTMNTFLPMTLLYPDTSLPQTLVYPIVKSDTSLPLTLLYLLLKKTPVYLGTLLLRDIKYNLLDKENGGNIKPGPTLFSVRDAHLLHYPTYKKLCFLNVHYR